MAAEDVVQSEQSIGESIIKPTIVSINNRAILDSSLYPDDVKIIVECLQASPLGQLFSNYGVVAERHVLLAYKTAVFVQKKNRIVFDLQFENKSRQVSISFTQFAEALGLEVPKTCNSPSQKDVLDMFNEMGAHPEATIIKKAKKSALPPIWNFFFTMFRKCLGCRSGGLDAANTTFMGSMYGIYYGIQVPYASIFWNDFVESTKTKDRQMNLNAHRFWSLVVRYVCDRENVPFKVGDEPLFTILDHNVPAKLEKLKPGQKESVVPSSMLDLIKNRKNVILVTYLKKLGISHLDKGKGVAGEGSGVKKEKNVVPPSSTGIIDLDIGEEVAAAAIGSLKRPRTQSSPVKPILVTARQKTIFKKKSLPKKKTGTGASTERVVEVEKEMGLNENVEDDFDDELTDEDELQLKRRRVVVSEEEEEDADMENVEVPTPTPTPTVEGAYTYASFSDYVKQHPLSPISVPSKDTLSFGTSTTTIPTPTPMPSDPFFSTDDIIQTPPHSDTEDTTIFGSLSGLNVQMPTHSPEVKVTEVAQQQAEQIVTEVPTIVQETTVTDEVPEITVPNVERVVEEPVGTDTNTVVVEEEVVVTENIVPENIETQTGPSEAGKVQKDNLPSVSEEFGEGGSERGSREHVSERDSGERVSERRSGHDGSERSSERHSDDEADFDPFTFKLGPIAIEDPIDDPATSSKLMTRKEYVELMCKINYLIRKQDSAQLLQIDENERIAKKISSEVNEKINEVRNVIHINQTKVDTRDKRIVFELKRLDGFEAELKNVGKKVENIDSRLGTQQEEIREQRDGLMKVKDSIDEFKMEVIQIQKHQVVSVNEEVAKMTAMMTEFKSLISFISTQLQEMQVRAAVSSSKTDESTLKAQLDELKFFFKSHFEPLLAHLNVPVKVFKEQGGEGVHQEVRTEEKSDDLTKAAEQAKQRFEEMLKKFGPTDTGSSKKDDKGKGVAGENVKPTDQKPKVFVKKAWDEATIRSVAFCDIPQYSLAPFKQQYDEPSSKDNQLDMAFIPLLLTVKPFVLNTDVKGISDKTYMDTMVKLYATQAKDQDSIWSFKRIRKIIRINDLRLDSSIFQLCEFIVVREGEIEESITLADLPFLNPADLFVLLRIMVVHDGKKGTTYTPHIKHLRVLLRMYYETVAKHDGMIARLLKIRLRNPDVFKVGISKLLDGEVVREKHDMGVVLSPNYGQNTRLKRIFLRIVDVGMFPSNQLTMAADRVIGCTRNSIQDKTEVYNILTWAVKFRSFLEEQHMFVYPA